MQRLCEYRARIGRDVLAAVGVYLTDTCGDLPSAIEDYVGHLLEEGKAQYMWLEHESDDEKVSLTLHSRCYCRLSLYI